jgi:hypothetical protein
VCIRGPALHDSGQDPGGPGTRASGCRGSPEDNSNTVRILILLTWFAASTPARVSVEGWGQSSELASEMLYDLSITSRRVALTNPAHNDRL